MRDTQEHVSLLTEESHPLMYLMIRSASGRFFWLLLALIGFILFDGVGRMLNLSRLSLVVPLLAVLIATGIAARHSPKRLLRSIVLSVGLLAIGGLATILQNHNQIYLWACSVLLLLCILDAISYALGYMLRGGTIDADHIYAAICVYLLIIILFATLYWMMECALPKSFVAPPDDPDGLVDWPDLLYFSFATFATVGYGDITPRQPLVRAISMLEMLVGTFYIAVVIARMTGLYSTSISSHRKTP